MKLVTFMDDADSSARLGVLVEGDSKILDLQGAEERRRGRPASAYQSMQHLSEGGDRALDRARAIAADHEDGDCVQLRGEGQLLATLSRPIQMRDWLCFENHLRHGLEGSNRTRGITEGQRDKDKGVRRV